MYRLSQNLSLNLTYAIWAIDCCRILEVVCRSLRLPPDFDFAVLSRQCPGFVGADLVALCREAAINAVNRQANNFKFRNDNNKLLCVCGEGGGGRDYKWTS